MDIMLPNSLELSVVVPVRDRFDELRNCLRALAAQTLSLERFEILVCDDGSVPPVLERGDDLGSSQPVTRYLRQPRRGPAAARNLGIRHARAPIVTFIDSDTIPQPDCLSALVRALVQNPDAVGVEGAVIPPRPRSSPLEEAPRNECGGVFLTANAAYRREALQRIGGFDEAFPYAAFEDADLALEMNRLGRIVWAPDAVVIHPWRRMTWRAAAQRVNYMDSLLRLALRHGCLGWRHHPTNWPRLRVAVAASVMLPVGRICDAASFIKCRPIDSLLRVAHSIGEAVLALGRLPFWLLCPQPPRRSAIDQSRTSEANMAPTIAAKQAAISRNQERHPRVGVVVVNYRTPEDTLRCVRSLLKLDYSNFEVIVVDNASGDGSAERLGDELPSGVQLIAASSNGGYTGGNNLGIRLALERGAEFVHLVNPDTVVIGRNYLRELVRHMELNPEVGVCGPRVHLRQAGCIQDTVLRFPWIWRSLRNWFSDRLIGPVNRTCDTIRQVEALNGVCVLIRRACLEQAGMLDEAIFAYVEDVEFAARCRKAGWQLHHVPVDSVLHLQKRAGYELDSVVSFLLKRNTAYFLMRSGHPVQAYAYIVLSLVLCLLRSCTSLALGQVRRARRFLRFNGLLARSYVLLLKPERLTLGMGPPPEALAMPCDSSNASSRTGRKKLCIVSQVPTPYREPLFERLANQPQVDLKVFYFTAGVRGVAWKSDRTAAMQRRGYACEVLPNLIPRCFSNLPVLGYVNCSIVRRLAAERPHYVVIYGYNFVTQFLAIAYCWWTGTPYALRSDSNGFCEPTCGWAHRLKRMALRDVVKNAHAVLCVGSANRRYWEIFGAQPRQLLDAPYAVDTDWLSFQRAQRAADAAELRNQLGWSGKCLFLFAGRLASEKGVDALVDAMNLVCAAREDVALAIVGDGPLRESLARRIGPCTAHLIRFLGQASYAEMPMYYAMADVLILPSRQEAWGLVINEAMLCGLPVIATTRCGATHDLLPHGKCGLKVEHSSAASLAQAMLWMVEHPEARRAMGQIARTWASQWSFDRTIRGFLAAFEGADASRSDPGGSMPGTPARAA